MLGKSPHNATRAPNPVFTHRHWQTRGTPTLSDPHTNSTAQIRLRNSDEWHVMRALINPSKPQSTISSDIVKRLKFTTSILQSKEVCRLTVGSKQDGGFCTEVTALVTPQLPRNPYESDIPESARKPFEHLVLADPQFLLSTSIVVELGADIYPRILRSGFIPNNDGLAVAQSTEFGWVITGPCQT